MDSDAQNALADLLVAYFGDLPLKAGVSEMVRVTAFNSAYHETYSATLRSGLEAAESGDPDVLTVIRRRYAPFFRELSDVSTLLSDILTEYDSQYDAATG